VLALCFLVGLKIMVNKNTTAIIIATHISKEKNPLGNKELTNGTSE
jgi:hypothetical protein